MDTSEQLLLTAERLYGERGLNGVSLREIVREAGQKNASAAHYHFGSRTGLIEAIFEKRMSMLDQRRMELLDGLDSTADLGAIGDAIARPLVELMQQDGPAAHYVRFLAEMFLSHEFRVDDFVEGRFNHGMHRAFAMAAALLPDLPDKVVRQRFLIGVHAMVFSLADIDTERSRRAEAGETLDIEMAVASLVDMWAGGMAAPLSSGRASRLRAA